MQTEKVGMNEDILNCPALASRVNIRNMSADEWVEKHASGTLRKNKRIGFAWRSQYLEERIAYEFGWEFKILPRSCVTFGDAITEGDCHSITETGWHMERYIAMKIFPEDYYEAKYIQTETSDGSKSEGIGLIVRETSAPWIPDGHVVFAIIAEFDTNEQKWCNAQNPF